MKYIKVEKDIWQLGDGSLFEGAKADLPKSNASKLAGAGKTYPEDYLKEIGYLKDKPKEDKPKAKKSQKKVENKAVKPKDVEDK